MEVLFGGLETESVAVTPMTPRKPLPGMNGSNVEYIAPRLDSNGTVYSVLEKDNLPHIVPLDQEERAFREGASRYALSGHPHFKGCIEIPRQHFLYIYKAGWLDTSFFLFD